MDGDAHRSFVKAGGAPPTMDQADAMRRWDPWVRSTIAVTKLTNRMRYSKTSANSYMVEYVTNGGTTKTLVELTRPSKLFFEKQLGFVQSWAELRDERGAEVLTQIDNQFAFIAAATGLNIARKKYTTEWLMVAVQFTIEVELMFKHAFACYRPVELSPQVQPIITTPGHGTYPMGHCAQAFATIVALSGLLGVHPSQWMSTGSPPAPHPAYTQLRLQARRFSVNRVVAGTHFPIDAAAGQILGTTLGEVFLRRCNVAVPCKERSFAPALAGDDGKNDYLGEGLDIPNGGALGATVTGITSSSYLERLTELAQAEWDL
jgi:membrane-associated phospholipid phosphatase